MAGASAACRITSRLRLPCHRGLLFPAGYGEDCESRVCALLSAISPGSLCISLIFGNPFRIWPRRKPDPAGLQATGFHHTGWNGLGAVFDLKQSSEGYLWLTTSEGVLRFDGVRFESVEEVTRGAVHDNEIDSVFLSSSGGLWFTTQGAGLLLWKDGQLTTFPDRRRTPIRKQGKIIEDRDGSLWVQATAGLFHLRGSVCEQIGADQGYPGGFPAGILLDSDGTLWVKTRTSGLSVFAARPVEVPGQPMPAKDSSTGLRISSRGARWRAFGFPTIKGFAASPAS